MKTLNLQIFSKKEDLYSDIIDLMCRFDKNFRRNLSLEKIFEENFSEENKKENITYEHSFNFENSEMGLFGQVFEGDNTDFILLNNATHIIKSIKVSSNSYSAEVDIIDSPKGKYIQLYQKEFLRLRPVYTGNQLVSFNIEMTALDQTS